MLWLYKMNYLSSIGGSSVLLIDWIKNNAILGWEDCRLSFPKICYQRIFTGITISDSQTFARRKRKNNLNVFRKTIWFIFSNIKFEDIPSIFISTNTLVQFDTIKRRCDIAFDYLVIRDILAFDDPFQSRTLRSWSGTGEHWGLCAMKEHCRGGNTSSIVPEDFKLSSLK